MRWRAQFALDFAAGLGPGGNESYPEMLVPFGGFSDDTPVENGTIDLPETPVAGLDAESALLDRIRSLFA